MLASLTLAATALGLLGSAHAGPQRIRGVNRGNQFIVEPWMSPNEWKQMGGERCDEDCSSCAASEFTLVQKLGQTKADKVFAQHWETWFTQRDVELMVNYGINTVRMPVGWWIVEELKTPNEHFPAGQLPYLKKALRMLKNAGIWVLIDIHANPGVQSANQQFTGWCKAEPGFYTKENYARDVKASAVLASLVHADPDFSMVYSIGAVNEPEADPTLTPGLEDFYGDFVDVIRAVERWHGMPSCTEDISVTDTLDQETKELIKKYWTKAGVKAPSGLSDEDESAVSISGSIEDAPQPGNSECIVTTFQSSGWQWPDPTANQPAKVANGPINYDQHLYYSFGGVVSNSTPQAYMEDVCNGNRFEDSDKNRGEDSQLAFMGEWWLAAEWTGEGVNKTNDAFYREFGDAQKIRYGSQSKGWFFWSWKVEDTKEFGYTRDYRQAVANGLLTANPDAVFNPDVCKPYIKEPEASGSASGSASVAASASGSSLASSAVASSVQPSSASAAGPTPAPHSASLSRAAPASKATGPSRLSSEPEYTSSKAETLANSGSSLGAMPLASDGLLRWA